MTRPSQIDTPPAAAPSPGQERGRVLPPATPSTALPTASRLELGVQPRVDLRYGPGGRDIPGAPAYAAAARLSPDKAQPTRLLAPSTEQRGPRLAFEDPGQADAYAQDTYASLTSAVSQINRAMVSISSASVQRYLVGTGAGGEAAIRAMANSLRDANTRVEIAVKRLKDAFQVSGMIVVKMPDGTVETGAFSLSYVTPSGDGTFHSPAAAESPSVSDDSTELTGWSDYEPGSSLDMRI